MARTRMIKADFFRSRSLAKVSIPARLTFIGLWTEADAAGRGIAHPAILKGSIWPLDDAMTGDQVAAHLTELADTGHIVLYETTDGDALFQIANWAKHQTAAYRTGESKHPAPPSDDEFAREVVQVAREVVQTAQQVVQTAREPVQLAQKKMRLMHDDSAPYAREVVHKGNRREEKGNEESAPTPSTRPANTLWDALSVLFGEPSTNSEKSNRGRHVRELAQAGATASEIEARAAEHARRKLGWTLTANSLVSHWTELAPAAAPQPKIDPDTGAVLSPLMRQ